MDNNDRYRNMSQKERNERLERAKNNSVKTRNPDIVDISYQGKRYKITAQQLKVGVVTTFLAAAIAVTGMVKVIEKGVENIQDRIAISSVCEEYSTIVSDNTHRTQKKDNYWHDPRGIAIDILQAEDRDLAIYSVYSNIDYNRTKNMTDIFNEIDRVILNNPEYYSDIPLYGGYENYLKNMGCVDKKGNISVEKYREKMSEYAVSVANLDKAKSNINK